MQKIILVRHGETDIDVVGKMHLSGDATPLNALGVEQINQTAEKLQEFKPSTVYSSKEARAVESGEIIAKVLDIELEQVDELQERNWGDLSGRSWSDIQEILRPMTLEERYVYVPQNGESWQVFEERLIRKIIELADKHKDETIIVVTHGGAIRALMPYFLNVPKEESFKHNPDNASITVFEREDGMYKEVTVNNTDHLKQDKLDK
jgi:broad specificity phosphatase PhoE